MSGSRDQALKELFLLAPDVVFLNHGSYGAMPRPVMETYQDWQRQLEHQPVEFINDALPAHLATAREALGDYLGVAEGDLVYVPNATFGMNVVAQSLTLGPGDEVLATNHEYGAIDNLWESVCSRRGARYVRRPLPFSADADTDQIECLWAGVTPRTRVIFLSHITSPTALHLPVEALCARARAAGILSVVDGAHAPGQIPLNLSLVDADFYVGNCHKWLCSPKGAGFLYARPTAQALLEPLVIGWGAGENRRASFGSDFLDRLQWLGTIDPSAYLTVPAAIRFQEDHDWWAVRDRCHTLLHGALDNIQGITGIGSPYAGRDALYAQMAVAELPAEVDPVALKRRLYHEFAIEVPVIHWQDRLFVRVSIQGYNGAADIDALSVAMHTCLPDRALRC